MDQDNQKVIDEMRQRRGAAKDAAKKISSFRNAALVTLLEVFFRKDMGERYYSLKDFFQVLIGLAVLKGFFYMFGSGDGSGIEDLIGPAALFGVEETVRQAFPITEFDVFILIFIAMSGVHYLSVRRRKAEGRITHTYYMGDSRLAFIARLMKAERPHFAAYLYVEPLVVLLCVLPIFSYSLVLGGLAVIGGFQLWWSNKKAIDYMKHQQLDQQDSRILATHASKAASTRSSEYSSLTPPPLPSTGGTPSTLVPPPLPIQYEDDDDLTPEDALKDLYNEQEKPDE